MVNILGAGPAGLSSAVYLAKKGHSVDVFESTSRIGGHSEINTQAIRNYGPDKGIIEKLSRYGVELKHLNPIHKILKYSPTHRVDEIYSSRDPLFYTLLRGPCENSLECQLAEQAEKFGAKIHLGVKKKASECDILAVGSKFTPLGVARGIVVENANFDSDEIVFFYGNEFVEHGYAYLTPFGKNLLTISITSFDKTDFPLMTQKFDTFIEKDPIVREILKGSTLKNKFVGYGHYNIPETAIHKEKLLVGGAAGFVDPARGFGVKYALLSGILAGESIETGQDYDSLWKKEFGQELLSGFNRRVLLEKLTLADYEKFIKGQKISIENYEKTPNSFKEFLLQINGMFHLNKWRNQFDHEKYHGLGASTDTEL